MRRIWMFGRKTKPCTERPYVKNKKNYDDDETYYSLKPNDIGYQGSGDSSSYAPHLAIIILQIYQTRLSHNLQI